MLRALLVALSCASTLCIAAGTAAQPQSEAKKPGSPVSSAIGISDDEGSRVLPVIA